MFSVSSIQISKRFLLILPLILLIQFIAFLPAIDAMAAELKVLSGEQMIGKIKQDKDKSKVIFMFASWCGFCKQAMAQLVDVSKGDLKDSVGVFYISLDHDYDALVKFTQNLDQNITIYHMTKVEDITDFFNTFSVNYTNSVPHITIIDSGNKTIADGKGSIAAVEKKIRNYLGQAS